MKQLTINVAEISELEVIYEDQSIFALNKPHSIHSVVVPGSRSISIAEKLLARFPELDEVADKAGDAGLVNRLDFETSGLLLGAKSKAVWRTLREAQSREQISKRYLVLLEGCLEMESEVSNYLGSRYRGSKKVTAYDSAKPRTLNARSIFLPLLYTEKFKVTLSEVVLHSARRHQVRVHAAGLGHPLCGDRLYGAKSSISDLTLDRKVPPFLLHAAELHLMHPLTGEALKLLAPTPSYLSPFAKESRH